MSIVYDPYSCGKQIAQLQAANARLEKMLELAAEGTIGTVEIESVPNHFHGLFNGRIINFSSLYNTPLEALEAAYAEWKKREIPNRPRARSE